MSVKWSKRLELAKRYTSGEHNACEELKQLCLDAPYFLHLIKRVTNGDQSAGVLLVKAAELDGLMQRCLEGDVEAWEEFLTGIDNFVRACIRARPHNEMDTEDLSHTFYIERFLERDFSILRRFTWDRAFEVWLKRVISNFLTDHYRSRESERKYMRRKPDADRPVDSNVEQRVESSDTARHIDQIMQKELKPVEYTILRLHYESELSYDDIAQQLDMPSGTVASHINRAKNKLRDPLQDLL